MGLFDRFKKKPVEQVVEPVQALPEPTATPKMPKVKKPRMPKVKKPVIELTAKDKATKAGEPYVNVLSMEIDPTNLQNGAFELDWNEIFVARLVKSGYMMDKDDKDSDIVDRWFHQVCRNIVLEMYEQQQADPTNRDLREVNTRNLGNGRTEVS